MMQTDEVEIIKRRKIRMIRKEEENLLFLSASNMLKKEGKVGKKVRKKGKEGRGRCPVLLYMILKVEVERFEL